MASHMEGLEVENPPRPVSAGRSVAASSSWGQSPSVRVWDRDSKLLMGVTSFLMATALGMLTAAFVLIDKHGSTRALVGLAVGCSCIVVFGLVGLVGTCRDSKNLLLFFFYSIIISYILVVVFSIGMFLIDDMIGQYVLENWDDGAELSKIYTAATDAEATIRTDFLIMGIFGVILMILLSASLKLAVSVASRPVIMLHFMTNVNSVYLLLGCALVALGAFLIATFSGLVIVVGDVVVGLGAVAVVVAGLGLYGTRRRSRAILVAYIVMVSFIVLSLATTGIFLLATRPAHLDSLDNATFTRIVESLGYNTTTHDKAYFEGIIATDFKFAGIFCIALMLFSGFAVWGAWVLQRSGWVADYKITRI